MTTPVVHFFLFLSIYSNKTFLIMGQRLIISEEERRQINKMYGLVNEQTRLLLPDNLIINTLFPASRKVEGTLKLDNKTVKVDGDIVRVNAEQIEPKPENPELSRFIVKYDCKKDKYFKYWYQQESLESEIFLSDKAKEALKNIKTYCSGASAAL